LERQSQLGPSVRFGPFELDVRSAELQCNGRKILLHEQPFQVLLALLERPGELISRKELVQRLWPDGTFVDYERGLNKAVNKLRDVLRDSADSPRFVETIPRRGYRFIAPLEFDGRSPCDRCLPRALPCPLLVNRIRQSGLSSPT
jgi:DNA-binding winged helix-turn-helix (wHTH) protein